MSRERVGCPVCQAAGNDTQGNNLYLHEDKLGGWCYACSAYRTVSGGTTIKQQRTPDQALELASIKSYPFRALTDRNISKATCQKFGVRVALDEETATEPVAHFYPYHTSDGDIAGYKKRMLPKTFSVIGRPKGLFGQNVAKKNGKMLIVFGGEIDCMSGWEMLQRRDKSYNCVSLPNGEQLDPQTRKELDFFTAHQLVVICLDEDGVGRAAAKELAELLVSQVKVKIMRMKRKDTSEYLKADDVDGWWSALLGAEDFRPEKIENGSEISLEELLTPVTKGIFLDFIPETCKRLHGLRKGELTILLAPPGAGKTTFCRQLTYELITKQDDPVFNIFLEEGAKKTRQGLVALHAGVALNRFRDNPGCADIEKVKEAQELILPKLELVNHRGSLSNDSLRNQINYLVKAKGCKYGMLDHLSMVFSGRDDDNERKAMDKLVTVLGDMVEPLDFHLLVVVHINRKNRERDTGGEKRKYPYWQMLSQDDGRGSGIFEQVAWNLIGIEVEHLDPALTDTKGLTRTRIMKNREWSVVGVGDYLKYDTTTGTLGPVKVEY